MESLTDQVQLHSNEISDKSKGAKQTNALPLKLVDLGKITRPHGILGELKTAIANDYLDIFATCKYVYLNRTQRYRVRKSRAHQNAILLTLAGINTRNDAETVRGAVVSIDEIELPRLKDGEYYSHQIVGMNVITPNDAILGELVEVLATGSNDVYVIKQPNNKELLLPAIDSVIQSIDVARGIIIAVVPDGL